MAKLVKAKHYNTPSTAYNTFSFFLLLEVLGAAAFDKGDAQMWTQEIQCRENEYQFALCPASPSQFCSHDNHVSVVCAGR